MSDYKQYTSVKLKWLVKKWKELLKPVKNAALAYEKGINDATKELKRRQRVRQSRRKTRSR